MPDSTIDRARPKSARVKADARIMMRMPSETRSLIDSAARTRGTTRTDFMLDAAREKAVETLLKTLLIRLDVRQSDELDAIFADPPEPNEALVSLMAKPRPWE
jgi:uncharacterized protein (DUF1778 family)